MEALDELFKAKVSARYFNKYQTTGFGARIAEVEDFAHGDVDGIKAMGVVRAKQVDEEADVNA